MIWTSAKQLVDSIVFPNLLQIFVKPLTVQYMNIWVLFKYFNMQSLKSSIWNRETSLHPAYKATLIASLNREGFGSAIIPVGPIGHLVLRIDLPSFGQYSIGVDVVIRLKFTGKWCWKQKLCSWHWPNCHEISWEWNRTSGEQINWILLRGYTLSFGTN